MGIINAHLDMGIDNMVIILYMYTDTHFVSIANRSTSISSLLSRTVSFSKLNVDKEEGEEKGEQDITSDHKVSDRTRDYNISSSNLCSKSLTNMNTLSSVAHSRLLEDDGQLSLSSGHLDKTAESASSPGRSRGNRDGDSVEEMETAKGGYLGRFTNDRRGMLDIENNLSSCWHVCI